MISGPCFGERRMEINSRNGDPILLKGIVIQAIEKAHSFS
jgi:hypothetical protein